MAFSRGFRGAWTIDRGAAASILWACIAVQSANTCVFALASSASWSKNICLLVVLVSLGQAAFASNAVFFAASFSRLICFASSLSSWVFF